MTAGGKIFSKYEKLLHSTNICIKNICLLKKYEQHINTINILEVKL